MRNWEDIKRIERGDDPGSSVLDGVPGSLPALLKAFRMTEKAAAVGFDWRKPADVMAKMREEMDELEAELEAGEGAATDRVRAEMGDILFVMANLARHLGVEPETALQQTNATFLRRFQGMEERSREMDRDFRAMDLAEQDALWEEVKSRGDLIRVPCIRSGRSRDERFLSASPFYDLAPARAAAARRAGGRDWNGRRRTGGWPCCCRAWQAKWTAPLYPISSRNSNRSTISTAS